MEQKQYKRTTVTAALPYANGGVHIGHLAGVYVPADIYVRYLRLKKKDVVFIGGSDEHGVPVTIRARKEGITVQEVVDRYHEMIKKSFEEFGISFDIYSRTTSETHHKFASDFFRKDDTELCEKVNDALEARHAVVAVIFTTDYCHCRSIVGSHSANGAIFSHSNSKTHGCALHLFIGSQECSVLIVHNDTEVLKGIGIRRCQHSHHQQKCIDKDSFQFFCHFLDRC